MATRKKSRSKTRNSSAAKTRRATSAARSARKRATGQPSAAGAKKRRVRAKTLTSARGTRKSAGADKTREKAAAILKRKRKVSSVSASARLKAARAQPKSAGRKTVKTRTLGKSKPASVRRKVTALTPLRAISKPAEAKLRSKTDRKGEKPQTSAQIGLRTPPAAEARTTEKSAAQPVASTSAAKSPLAKGPRPATREETLAVPRPTRAPGQRQGFKLNEFVVYPAHGVGQIVAIEEQEVAGFKLELFVINFAKDKMTLRVPTSKVAGVGMRKISDPDTAKRSLEILTGRARVKRTMWSRRAQEYETKINSGDIHAIAEVVRDLYRSEAQPEQSYSERQLYEAALDRMVREIAAVHKSNEIDALKAVESQLQKSQNRGPRSVSPQSEAIETVIEEAA
jgi:CarD family transcriptional regulator